MELSAIVSIIRRFQFGYQSMIIGVLATLITACVPTKNVNQQSASSTPMVTQSASSDSHGDNTYVIGEEDVLKISVWKEPELDREVVVRPDGRISFPLIGDVMVKDKSVDEVKNAVKGKLKKYIPKAEVSVSLVRSGSYKIYVLGKVNNPGQFILGSYVDVLQAISLANGLTAFAAADNIRILRRKNGEEISFPFQYSSASIGQNMEQNIVLKSGDVVLVP